MAYPKNYRYTKEHEWVSVEGGLANRVVIRRDGSLPSSRPCRALDDQLILDQERQLQRRQRQQQHEGKDQGELDRRRALVSLAGSRTGCPAALVPAPSPPPSSGEAHHCPPLDRRH